jgi:hypothetical protein
MNKRMSEEDEKRVRTAVQTLAEFFDTVQIFCTRQENTEGGTIHVQRGEGNWFARVGQTRDWLLHHDEVTREQARKRVNEVDGDKD